MRRVHYDRLVKGTAPQNGMRSAPDFITGRFHDPWYIHTKITISVDLTSGPESGGAAVESIPGVEWKWLIYSILTIIVWSNLIRQICVIGSLSGCYIRRIKADQSTFSSYWAIMAIPEICHGACGSVAMGNCMCFFAIFVVEWTTTRSCPSSCFPFSL